MDFVVELLELLEFNMLMTVVNSMFKKIHFIITYTTITIERIFLFLLFLFYSTIYNVGCNGSLQ